MKQQKITKPIRTFKPGTAIYDTDGTIILTSEYSPYHGFYEATTLEFDENGNGYKTGEYLRVTPGDLIGRFYTVD